VLVSPYVTHRDPNLFPDPSRFDPDRWIGDKKATLHKFAYFPFGGGPRVCIGEQFAWIETLIVVSTLLPRWRFEPSFEGPLTYRATLSLRPKNDCLVTVRRR
jgi:cytochrome P450